MLRRSPHAYLYSVVNLRRRQQKEYVLYSIPGSSPARGSCRMTPGEHGRLASAFSQAHGRYLCAPRGSSHALSAIERSVEQSSPVNQCRLHEAISTAALDTNNTQSFCLRKPRAKAYCQRDMRWRGRTENSHHDLYRPNDVIHAAVKSCHSSTKTGGEGTA